MSQNQIQDGQTVTRVAIVMTSVSHVKAYHAKCLECDWQTRRFNREKTAVGHAKKHRCDQ